MIEDYEVALVQSIRSKFDRLREARCRVDELSQAFDVVERSKFALLRRIGVSAANLLSGPSATSLNNALEARLGVSTGTEALPLLSRAEVIELQAERLSLMDSVVAERTSGGPTDLFARWMLRSMPRKSDIDRMRKTAKALAYRPLFSVVMATYNTPERYLREAIDSVRNQAYDRWELCIADDASPDQSVRAVLAEYAGLDSRIKVTMRSENGHISKATNSALDLATGDFVGFLDHDDLLTPDALFEMALELGVHRETDVIYSDEDKIDDEGRFREPHFKPDWCPDSFLSRMYTCHFTTYRRSLIEDVGRLRSQFDGSQDYDLMLRISERTPRIRHIPKVLYHWRLHSGSTAAAGAAKPYTSRAAETAISEALERRGEPGVATERSDCPGTYIVRYALREKKKVSIVIPTRNHGDDVDRCFTSIFNHSAYDNFEIVLLDNGSDDSASLAIFEKWARRDSRIQVIRHDVPFNFSAINNYAVSKASGAYVLLLNNDTEVITSDWLEAMVEQAQRPTIGAVGAMLLYPDRTIQHAGVVVGIGGVAGHSHKNFPSDAYGYMSMIKSINNYSAVTAACLMLRRSVFDEVGGLDEGLAVAFNDVDFCLRILKAGYRNVYLPHVQLYHFESKSRGYEDTPEKQERFSREVRTMFSRWDTEHWPDPCYNPNLTLEHENFTISDK